MATTTIGTIQLLATIDTSQYKKGAKEIESTNDRLDKSTQKTDSKAKKLGSSFASLAVKGFKIATVAAVGLGTAITAMTLKGGIDRALNIEDAQAKLRGLGHDTKSVTTIMGNALDSVRGTAFGLDAAATTAANAVASGVKPGKQLAQVLKTVANTSALAGRDMSELGAIFNKVAASNKVQMDVINQLHDAGVPALALLSKEIGKTAEETAEMASAGEIDFATFERAMRKGVGDAAVEMGKTTRGSFANMRAAMSRVGAAIVKDIIPKIRGGIQSLTKWFDDNSDNIVNAVNRAVEGLKGFATATINVGKQVAEYLQPKFTALYNTIVEKLVPILKELWHNVIEPLIPVIGTTLVIAIGLTIDALNLLVSGFSWVYQAMKDGNPIIWGLIGLFGSLAAVMAFNKIFNALTVGFNTLRLITIPNAMASITALKNLIASPTVMGAIGVGAALAAILLVKQRLDQLKAEIKRINEDTAKAADSQHQAVAQLRDLARSGTPAQRKRALKALDGLSARGYASGGFTGVGPADEVAGLVHRGEFVLPKEMVNQTTGLPKQSRIEPTQQPVIKIPNQSTSEYRQGAINTIKAYNQYLHSKGLPLIGVA